MGCFVDKLGAHPMPLAFLGTLLSWLRAVCIEDSLRGLDDFSHDSEGGPQDITQLVEQTLVLPSRIWTPLTLIPHLTAFTDASNTALACVVSCGGDLRVETTPHRR